MTLVGIVGTLSNLATAFGDRMVFLYLITGKLWLNRDVDRLDR
jgi:hypothetical protein